MTSSDSYIFERQSKISKNEEIVREIFINSFNELSISTPNPVVLSVSTGDGSWDWDLIQKFPSLKLIEATDIIDFGISISDYNNLINSGKWNFNLVASEKPLDFPDNYFDSVFHIDVIEHVRKPFSFLLNQYHLLKPGGFIFIYTPNLHRPSNIVKLLFGKLKFPRTLGQNNTYGDCLHIQEFTKYQLNNMLQEVGFTDIQVIETNFGFPNFSIQKFPTHDLTKNLAHGLFVIARK